VRALDDEAGVDGAAPPRLEEGLDRLREPLRVEADAEAVALRPEAHELREPLRRQRADLLAPEGEGDRLVDEGLRLGDRRLGCSRRQLRLDVGERGRDGAPARADGAFEGVEKLILSDRLTGASRDDPERAAGGDDLCTAGLGECPGEALGEVVGAGPGNEDRVDRSAGGLGSTSCRTRRRNESCPAWTRAACVAASSTRRTVRGSTAYRSSPMRTSSCRSRATSRTATPGSGRSQ
jgi:hypothetical protein